MLSRALLPFGAATVVAACGGNGKLPPVELRPPATPSATAATPPAPPPKPMPAPLPGVALGSFGEGTFGPRVVRNGKNAILVSAPPSPTGRRWMATTLDEHDVPRGDSRHEVAEAPEDSSAWDVKPVGEGFVLAWTRTTEAGEQLFSVPLAADGSPRSAPTPVAKSSDALVAVRLVPLGAAGALLTFGEKTIPKGGTAAVGALFAIPHDALGRPTAAAATRIADRLSAWQVAATGPQSAVAALVQRSEPKGKDKPKDDPLAARDDLLRAAKVVTLTVASKSLVVSDALVLSGDEALPEIEVVVTGPGRALCVWSDRREIDAHLFSAAIDLGGSKPKLVAPSKRAVPARGDQAIVSLVPTSSGAVVLYETVRPRSVRDPRRRFDVVRLTPDGEATATPRGFVYPSEEDEPELTRAGDDDVGVLTYGAACHAVGDAPPTCDPKDRRPFVLRLSGPTLSPKQTELLDLGSVVGGAALHAFDLVCSQDACEAMVEGPNNPTTVALAKIAPRKEPNVRWVFTELVETAKAPPRLEGATALARELEFTGLHATRAGNGALVGWITWAPEEVEIEQAPPVVIVDKKKKGPLKIDKPPPKPKKKPAESGAHVAVRLVDSAGEPLGPVTTISDKGVSKGDVAVAFSEADKSGVVAYVSRAEGDEEVYVARVDAKGAKSGKPSRITNAPGTASDVAITSLPEGGYLLAWVDGRKGPPAIYAARLDKSGQKIGAEVKVGGGAGGDLSDLSMATIGASSSGARVVLAWSDGRSDTSNHFADVFFTIVGAKDLGKPLVAEQPIVKNKTHSHYPVVAARGDGSAVIAWLEDEPNSNDYLEFTGRSGWGTWLARIDGNGAVVQAPTQVPVDPELSKGVATGVSVECPTGPSSCRVAVAWAVREGVVLVGTSLGTGPTLPTARPFWSWYGAPSQEVAPALVGNSVFACEDGLEKDDGRVRRLSLSW